MMMLRGSGSRGISAYRTHAGRHRSVRTVQYSTSERRHKTRHWQISIGGCNGRHAPPLPVVDGSAKCHQHSVKTAGDINNAPADITGYYSVTVPPSRRFHFSPVRPFISPSPPPPRGVCVHVRSFTYLKNRTPELRAI